MGKYVIKYGDLYFLNVGTEESNFLTEDINKAFVWDDIKEAELWLETAPFYSPVHKNRFEYVQMLERLG